MFPTRSKSLFVVATLLPLVFFVGASSATGAILLRDYQLNGSFTDALGGAALTPGGGTLGPTRYAFGTNQGLTLSGGLSDPTDYSIEFKAEYDSLSPFWKKLVDFENLASDVGLYIRSDRLAFWQPGSLFGPDTVTANVDFHVVLTRDGTSGITTGYLNGVQQWTTGADSVSAGNILRFFIDDIATGQFENTSGSVDFIRIYDGPLTSDEVGILAAGGSITPVPEPTSLAIWGIVGLGGAFYGWRRKRRAAA